MPSGAASIIGTDQIAVPIALAPKLSGARLVTLEDGSVVALGGDTLVARYSPTTNGWTATAPTGDGPGTVTAPSLVRLDDGSVLVVGGSDGGPPSARAWLYRPSLVGPHAGQVVAFPDGSGAVLTTPNQSTATRIAGMPLVLTAPDDQPTARALVGGPRIAVGTLSASLQVSTGGVYLIAQQTGPGRLLAARLVPGESARIERRANGKTTTLCSGQVVEASDLAQSVSLAVTSDGVTASVGPADALTTKVSCDYANDPIAGERGAWGVAATANGMVGVVTVTVAR
jgi:hypothetical protein